MRALAACACFALTAAVPAAAANKKLPRPSLVEQESARNDFNRSYIVFRGHPEDFELARAVIAAARKLDKYPEEHEKARKHLISAAAIQKEAKTAGGLKLAIAEYREALNLSPWWPDANWNMAFAHVKLATLDPDGKTAHCRTAEKFLELYLATDPKDARQARDKLYALQGKCKLYETE